MSSSFEKYIEIYENVDNWCTSTKYDTVVVDWILCQKPAGHEGEHEGRYAYADFLFRWNDEEGKDRNEVPRALDLYKLECAGTEVTHSVTKLVSPMTHDVLKKKEEEEEQDGT